MRTSHARMLIIISVIPHTIHSPSTQPSTPHSLSGHSSLTIHLLCAPFTPPAIFIYVLLNVFGLVHMMMKMMAQIDETTPPLPTSMILHYILLSFIPHPILSFLYLIPSSPFSLCTRYNWTRVDTSKCKWAENASIMFENIT